jgi:uncharacterized membrane protein
MKFLELLTKYSTSIIAFLVIALCFFVLISIVFYDFPTEQKDIYFTISGGVLSIVTMIVSYYFGASNKDNEIKS